MGWSKYKKNIFDNQMFQIIVFESTDKESWRNPRILYENGNIDIMTKIDLIKLFLQRGATYGDNGVVNTFITTNYKLIYLDDNDKERG